jgi:hypothetical protein
MGFKWTSMDQTRAPSDRTSHAEQFHRPIQVRIPLQNCLGMILIEALNPRFELLLPKIIGTTINYTF